MMDNKGKIFEKQIGKELKKAGIWHYKIKDTYVLDRKTGDKTQINPYDLMSFYKGKMICLELKSTEHKTIGVQTQRDMPKAMIKAHQLLNLVDLKRFDNMIGGFLLEFRKEEKVFFVPADALALYLFNNNRKSVGVKECQEIGIEVECEKIRVNYTYNIKGLYDKLV